MRFYKDLPVDDQLLFSVQNGDIVRVKESLEKGGRIHQGPKDALMLASQNGYHEIIKLLFEYGADPNILDYGETVLYGILSDSTVLGIYDDVEIQFIEKVCNRSRARTVIELIKGGVDPNRKDETGETILMRVSEDCDTMMVLVLLREGADPFITNDNGDIFLKYLEDNDEDELIDYIKTSDFI